MPLSAVERECRAALKEHQRLHAEEISRYRFLLAQIKKRVLKNLPDREFKDTCPAGPPHLAELRRGILEDCNKGLDGK